MTARKSAAKRRGAKSKRRAVSLAEFWTPQRLAAQRRTFRPLPEKMESALQKIHEAGG